MSRQNWSPEEIAEVAYEANRALQDVLGESYVPQPWPSMTPAQRLPYIAAVRDAAAPLPFWRRLLGYHRRTCREQHYRWLAAKAKDGWTYGREVDPVAKTHPCMVLWDDLDPGQRQKDALFLAIVEVMS